MNTTKQSPARHSTVAAPAPHVLIVQRDLEYAALLNRSFDLAGFHVFRCAGPRPPDYTCSLLETQPSSTRREANWGKPRIDGRSYGCSLVEAADVLIYDPWLCARPESMDASVLVRALRRYYPDQTLVLAWPQESIPSLDPSILADPGVHIGPTDPKQLVAFVAKLGTRCYHTRND